MTGLGGACVLVALAAVSAYGGTDFSYPGSFATDDLLQTFIFTNSAGHLIPAGGFSGVFYLMLTQGLSETGSRGYDAQPPCAQFCDSFIGDQLTGSWAADILGADSSVTLFEPGTWVTGAVSSCPVWFFPLVDETVVLRRVETHF